MTNWDNADELAQIAFDTYYKDDLVSMTEHVNDPDTWWPDTFTFEQKLAVAVAEDIADLLHNGNQAELWPELDSGALTEAEEDRLLARLTDYNDELPDKLSDKIASLMLQ